MNLPPHLQRKIKRLFARMDQTYGKAAKRAGFVCRGCKHNCCLTRFYHHTILEYLYLRAGLAQLPSEVQTQIRRRAEDAVQQMQQPEPHDDTLGIMCPLNVDGRCSLYAWRPMICRLHGIPHQLRRPDGRILTGPGCDDFYHQCGASCDHALDRSPLYMEMAQLEHELRQHLQFRLKIKLTIAEMIVNEIH